MLLCALLSYVNVMGGMGAGLVTSCKEMKLIRSLTEHCTLCIQSQDGPRRIFKWWWAFKMNSSIWDAREKLNWRFEPFSAGQK